MSTLPALSHALLSPALLSHALAQLVASVPADLTNPPAAAPDGVEAVVNKLLGWGKWIAFVSGAAGLIVSGIMMTVGRRNRSQMSADGAIGLPWVLGGLSVVVLAVPLVNNLFA